MSNIKINDVPQRVQYAATGGQTQFTVPFPFFQNNFIYVWLNGVQLFMGGSPGQYVVTGAGSPSGGLVTFNTAATLNDIVTIEGIMPIDRTSIYSATISNLTGSDLNGDFNREVVMMKQIETTQSFMQLQYAPWAEISQDLTVTKDRYIPLLPELGAWRMNAAGTAIETFLTPDSPGLAPSDAVYILQTANSNLPDAIALDALTSGFLANTASFGLSAVREFEAEPNQLVVTNADGMGGNPVYGIADNAIIPGTAGMGIPAGTTLQRVIPTPPSIGMRFNTDLGQVEAYIGGVWVAIPSAAAGLFLPLAGGTMSGNIDMDSNIINGLPLPTNNDDAANKQYVDNAVGGAAGGVTGNMQWNNGGAFAGDSNFNTDGLGNVYINGVLDVDSIHLDGNRISPTSGMLELEDSQLASDMDADSYKIINLAICTVGTDAANKNYVDATAAGRYFVAPVRVSATANFSATYSNGTAGVGATLTATVNGAAALDGITLALNDRVLFPAQSSSFQNGIYTVTTLGSAGTPAIYTRATDYDEPTDIDPGDTVGVLQGNTYAGAFWMETSVVTAIGTDPITFILSVNPNVVTTNTTQTITGNKTFTGTNQLGNFIFTANQMQHASDTDNYFEFGTDIQNFVTGNTSRMDITNSGVRLGGANSRVTAILDEDTMSSNSDTSLATQQSIKAYVDSFVGGGHIAKNLIIGGDFSTNPWQRGTTFNSIAGTAYSADRWTNGNTTDAVLNITRQANSPTVVQAGILTQHSLQVAVATADTSITATQVCYVQQAIEGYNFTRIAQRAFTISFWVYATKTGVYCVSFNNSGQDRSYVAEYTVNTSNTWEYKTITVAASPAAGTWNYTTGIGISVTFALATGTNFQTTAGSWQTGNFKGTANQVNALDSTSNVFAVDLIQIESGSVATPFEIRTEQQELFLCQRYFYKTFNQGVAPANNAGTAGAYKLSVNVAGSAGTFGSMLTFPVPMRSVGAGVLYNPSANNSNWRNSSLGVDSGASALVGVGTNGAFPRNTQVVGDAVSNLLSIHLTVDAEL